MGFRRYVRQFLDAILMFLHPSLPWCFPIRELSFQQQQQQQQQQEAKVAKIIIFHGFQKLRRQFLDAILMLLRPSLPWCFPIREVSFQQQQQQQEAKVAKIMWFKILKPLSIYIVLHVVADVVNSAFLFLT